MHRRRNATVVLLSCLIVLNLAFQSCANWTLHVGGIKHRLIHRDAIAEIERYAPSRGLVRNRSRARSSLDRFILLAGRTVRRRAGRPGIHGFALRSRVGTRAHTRRCRLDRCGVARDFRAQLTRTTRSSRTIATTMPRSTVALSDAQLIRTIGSDQLWQLPPSKQASTDLVRARDFAREKFWP